MNLITITPVALYSSGNILLLVRGSMTVVVPPKFPGYDAVIRWFEQVCGSLVILLLS